MQDISASELFQRLAGIGAFLGAFTMSTELGPTTLSHGSVVAWQISDASTYAVTNGKPSTAELELALAEVQTARSILAQGELRREEGYETYLSTLNIALDAYERAGEQAAGREVSLATALAIARTVLQDGVRQLSSWLAVRRTGSDDRYLTVPERFLASESAELQHDEGLDDRSILMWLDLDSAGV